MEISKLATDVPAELIAELAVGIEEPDEIAYRHGIATDVWDKLKSWPPFLAEVAARRKELETSGATFRTKSRLKAEMLSDKIFVRTMASDAPLGGMLSALEHYVRVADLNPKQTVATGPTGSGFSITINLPGPAAPAKGDVIEHMTPEPLPMYMREKPIQKIEVKDD